MKAFFKKHKAPIILFGVFFVITILMVFGNDVPAELNK